MLTYRVQAPFVTGEHALEDRDGVLIGLCMSASKADQASWAMLAGGQCTKMCSDIAQVAFGGKCSPLLRGRVLHVIFTIVSVVQAADRLPILFDEPGGIELGVDHHCIRGRMAEKRLDDVHGCVVIQMFGSKNAPAIVPEKHERRAVGALRSGSDRKIANPVSL